MSDLIDKKKDCNNCNYDGPLTSRYLMVGEGDREVDGNDVFTEGEFAECPYCGHRELLEEQENPVETRLGATRRGDIDLDTNMDK